VSLHPRLIGLDHGSHRHTPIPEPPQQILELGLEIPPGQIQLLPQILLIPLLIGPYHHQQPANLLILLPHLIILPPQFLVFSPRVLLLPSEFFVFFGELNAESVELLGVDLGQDDIGCGWGFGLV
jgi:hypothetical protein